MFPVLIYAVVAVLAAISAQAFRPSEALRSGHHRKLYWTGAATAIGFFGLVAGVLIA
jgi:hypothetical protein